MMTEAFTTIQYSAPVRNRDSPKMKNRIPKSNSSIGMNVGGQNVMKRGGSFVVGQKLRESKWFVHSELSVVCAVLETGFIVELREHKDAEEARYGVVTWKPGHEKSKNPSNLTIHSVEHAKGKFKVVACPLLEFWPEGQYLRINNQNDKSDTPLTEPQIRNQIICAEYSKRKWLTSEHFTYFCRYGPLDTSFRAKIIFNQMKWMKSDGFFTKLKSLSVK